jgi:predicted RNA-binding Zn-ribbon protein involved in translation (DUF1610 family)
MEHEPATSEKTVEHFLRNQLFDEILTNIEDAGFNSTQSKILTDTEYLLYHGQFGDRRKNELMTLAFALLARRAALPAKGKKKLRRYKRYKSALEWLSLGVVPVPSGGQEIECADDVVGFAKAVLGQVDSSQCKYCRNDGYECPACGARAEPR